MKRPKPNKNRPMLVATEARKDTISLRILYPDWRNCDLLTNNGMSWVYGYNFSFEELKKRNKKYGWKTHFLGNL